MSAGILRRPSSVKSPTSSGRRSSRTNHGAAPPRSAAKTCWCSAITAACPRSPAASPAASRARCRTPPPRASCPETRARPPLERVAVHDRHVHEAHRLVGAPDDVQGARPRHLVGLVPAAPPAHAWPGRGRRPGCARTANRARGPAARRRSAPPPRGASPSASVRRNLDDPVACVIEVAAADGDVVVQPRRSRRNDRVERRRQGLVLEGGRIGSPWIVGDLHLESAPTALARVVQGALGGDGRRILRVFGWLGP